MSNIKKNLFQERGRNPLLKLKTIKTIIGELGADFIKNQTTKQLNNFI